ncbi:hypothetical protein STEG23_003079 [Scotinomys teguina]
MLLKWIVVGSVKEYVPTDLVDSKGMGQDPFFLSKPSSFPKAMETTTTTTSTMSPATPSAGSAVSSRTPNRISTRFTTITRAPTRFPGHRVPIRASPRSTTARNTAAPPTALSTTAPFFSSSTPGSRPPMPGAPSTQAMPSWPTAAYATSSYLHDSTPSWTLSPFQDAAAASSSSPSSTSSTTTTPETSTSPKFPFQSVPVVASVPPKHDCFLFGIHLQSCSENAQWFYEQPQVQLIEKVKPVSYVLATRIKAFSQILAEKGCVDVIMDKLNILETQQIYCAVRHFEAAAE